MSFQTTLLQELTFPQSNTRKYILSITKPQLPSDLNVSNVVVNLDTSGSMSGDPFRMATEGTELFIRDKSLSSDNTVSIFGFSNVVNCVLPPTKIGLESVQGSVENRDSMVQALKTLIVGGTTNIFGVLADSIKALESAEQSKPCHIVLLSDGQHNAKTHHTRDTVVKYANEKNVIIHCIGSQGHDTELMSYLAQETKGLYISITNFEQLASVIGTVVDCIQTYESKDLTINLTLLNNAKFVKANTVSSFPVDTLESNSSDNTMNINIGKFCRGETKEFAFTVQYSDMCPVFDDKSIVYNIHCTSIKSKTSQCQSSILSPIGSVAVSSEVDNKKYVPEYCIKMLNIITAKAMGKAQKMNQRNAIAHLESTILEITGYFEDYKSVIKQEQLDLIIQDILASINDLKKNNYDSFNTTAISYSSQTPSVACVVAPSDRMTSVSAMRSITSTQKAEDYERSKQIMRGHP